MQDILLMGRRSGQCSYCLSASLVTYQCGLVDAFIRGAEEAGHSVEKVSLLKTEVKGCMGCNACRYGRYEKYPMKDTCRKHTNLGKIFIGIENDAEKLGKSEKKEN